jgi:L-cystine transport system permease protein
MGTSFDLRLIFQFLPKLLSYLHITLLILVVSLVIGTLIGFLIALPRLYKIPVVNRLAMIYVSFVRGTPTLIQLFLVYYGLPEILKPVGFDLSQVSPIAFVITTYALSSGAFISEIIRSAVNSVDRGQSEAAYSVGMTGVSTFIRIVLPQALVTAFPNFANSVISFLKDTSLAFSVGVMDMVGMSQVLGTNTMHYLEIYISLAIIYYAICIVLERLFHLAEHRLQRHAITGVM